MTVEIHRCAHTMQKDIAFTDLWNFVICSTLIVLAVVTHTTLELVACVMTVIGFGLDVAGMLRNYDPGPAGMTMCYLIRGSTILIAASNGAITSVVMHTLSLIHI